MSKNQKTKKREAKERFENVKTSKLNKQNFGSEIETMHKDLKILYTKEDLLDILVILDKEKAAKLTENRSNKKIKQKIKHRAIRNILLRNITATKGLITHLRDTWKNEESTSDTSSSESEEDEEDEEEDVSNNASDSKMLPLTDEDDEDDEEEEESIDGNKIYTSKKRPHSKKSSNGCSSSSKKQKPNENTKLSILFELYLHLPLTSRRNDLLKSPGQKQLTAVEVGPFGPFESAEEINLQDEGGSEGIYTEIVKAMKDHLGDDPKYGINRNLYFRHGNQKSGQFLPFNADVISQNYIKYWDTMIKSGKPNETQTTGVDIVYNLAYALCKPNSDVVMTVQEAKQAAIVESLSKKIIELKVTTPITVRKLKKNTFGKDARDFQILSTVNLPIEEITMEKIRTEIDKVVEKSGKYERCRVNDSDSPFKIYQIFPRTVANQTVQFEIDNNAIESINTSAKDNKLYVSYYDPTKPKSPTQQAQDLYNKGKRQFEVAFNDDDDNNPWFRAFNSKHMALILKSLCRPNARSTMLKELFEDYNFDSIRDIPWHLHRLTEIKRNQYSQYTEIPNERDLPKTTANKSANGNSTTDNNNITGNGTRIFNTHLHMDGNGSNNNNNDDNNNSSDVLFKKIDRYLDRIKIYKQQSEANPFLSATLNLLIKQCEQQIVALAARINNDNATNDSSMMSTSSSSNNRCCDCGATIFDECICKDKTCNTCDGSDCHC